MRIHSIKCQLILFLREIDIFTCHGNQLEILLSMEMKTKTVDVLIVD